MSTRAQSGTTSPSLSETDLSPRLERDVYKPQLAALQDRLRLLQQAYLTHGAKAVVVMEGWDAAGKGGVIRRIASAMDPRGLKVWPIAAPRAYFKERHYLARFWEKLPPDGGVALFDRSWYGRVLVERVEGFASDAEWRRAYREINEFERQIHDDGAHVVKFFLHISPGEQLTRFRERLLHPAKRWKLSTEDFRNRAKWDAYYQATEDMLAETSTAQAPWRVVAAEDKKHARVAVISHLCDALETGVPLSPPPLDPVLADAARDALGLSGAELSARLGGDLPADGRDQA